MELLLLAALRIYDRCGWHWKVLGEVLLRLNPRAASVFRLSSSAAPRVRDASQLAARLKHTPLLSRFEN